MKNKIAECAEQQDEGKEKRCERKGGWMIKRKVRVAKDLCVLFVEKAALGPEQGCKMGRGSGGIPN